VSGRKEEGGLGLRAVWACLLAALGVVVVGSRKIGRLSGELLSFFCTGTNTRASDPKLLSRPKFTVRLVSVLGLFLLTIPRVTWAEDLRKVYEQMQAANQMDAIGRDPFYIKIAAQLYDLEGKPAQTATVEEWWEAERYRIQVTEPAGQFVQTSEPDSKHLPLTRTAFLLRLLLDETINPLSKLTKEATFTSVDREVGGMKFRCLVASWSGKDQHPWSQPLYCTLPGSNDLRLETHNPVSVQVRNNIGRFHGTAVPLKTQMLYGGHLAITGEVTSLQSFDVKTSTFPEFRPGEPGSDESEVKRGKKLSGDSPNIPVPANLHGPDSGWSLVLLSISATGTVTSTDVIASTSSFLSAAALRSVRTWKFTPWSRDGKPTEGFTLVQFNFIH